MFARSACIHPNQRPPAPQKIHDAMAEKMDTKFREYFPKLPQVRRVTCCHPKMNLGEMRSDLTWQKRKWSSWRKRNFGEMTKTWGWWKYYHSEWNTLFFCSGRMFMICGCCFLWWILSTLRIRYASWRCSKVEKTWLLDLFRVVLLVNEHHLTGHFFPQERNLHFTGSTQKKHALSSGYVRGVARRRCSDHWYSGDWDQGEGYPVSILFMALH